MDFLLKEKLGFHKNAQSLEYSIFFKTINYDKANFQQFPEKWNSQKTLHTLGDSFEAKIRLVEYSNILFLVFTFL